MWILVAMIMVMPFEKNPHLKISESLLGVLPDFTVIKLLGLIGLGWVVMEFASGRVRLLLLDSRQTKAFLIFLGTAVFASIASGAGTMAVSRLLSIVLFLPLTLSAVRTEANLKLALRASALVMVLTFPYAYRQMMRYGGRLGVGLYEPNYLALGLLLMLPLLFVFARSEKVAWKRLLWWAGLGVVFIGIILTGSRGGFLGLAVMLPLLAVRLMRQRVLALGGMVAVLLLLLVLPTALSHRLRSGLDSDVQDVGAQASVETRLDILTAGLRMIRDNPLTGVGLGNYKPSTSVYGAHIAKIAHNTYIELAAEMGLPALAAFGALLWVTLGTLRRVRRLAVSIGRSDLAALATAMSISLSSYIVAATFLSAQFEKFFWLIVFLSICFDRVVRRLAMQPAPARPLLAPRPHAAPWKAGMAVRRP